MKEVIILKRILITMLCLILFLAACGNGDDSSKSNSKEDKGTKSYTTDDGSKVKIPKNPKRVFCLLYTSPSPRDPKTSRMPSSA